MAYGRAAGGPSVVHAGLGTSTTNIMDSGSKGISVASISWAPIRKESMTSLGFSPAR